MLEVIVMVATVVAAGAAVWAVVAESRRIRTQLAIDNMWRLIDRWEKPDTLQLRARLAQRLLSHPDERNDISDDGIDVLNTFELLGFLVVKSRTLRLEYAWINFSVWAISWWYVYRNGIDNLRRMKADDLTIFEDYAELVGLFIKFEAEKRELPIDQVVPREEDLRAVLESETRLVRREVSEETLGLGGTLLAAIRKALEG